MAELSDEHRKNFEDRLRELGMHPTHVHKELRTGDTPGPTYISSDPAHESAVWPQPLTVNNVDDLKRLGGIPDADYDSGYIKPHHDPLEPWPEEKSGYALEDLEAEERLLLRLALAAYVYGHSDSVASYKTILDNAFFPIEAAAFAVENVTVSPGQPLILAGNNVAYNFGIVTIEPGGQIIVLNDCTLTCQDMVLQ